MDSMPRAAIEAGSASRVVPLDALPSFLTTAFERPLSDPYRHVGSDNPPGSKTMNRMGGGEITMEFKPLTFEDNPQGPLLVVDDSVVARKNLLADGASLRGRNRAKRDMGHRGDRGICQHSSDSC